MVFISDDGTQWQHPITDGDWWMTWNWWDSNETLSLFLLSITHMKVKCQILSSVCVCVCGEVKGQRLLLMTSVMWFVFALLINTFPLPAHNLITWVSIGLQLYITSQSQDREELHSKYNHELMRGINQSFIITQAITSVLHFYTLRNHKKSV